MALPAPDTLTEEEIHGTLWEVIRALAELRIFLECTDHMSDRELYQRLWNEDLRAELMYAPGDPFSACHLDFSGSGGDAHDRYLMYYADEEQRERWAMDDPEDEIPPHTDPPFSRDRLLPRAYDEMEPS